MAPGEKMQKIKSLLGGIKNPKINQDVEGLLKEVKSITKKLQADEESLRRLEDENQKLTNELLLVCERLDETSLNIKMFIEKIEDTKAACIAITSWAVFFVSVAGAVYAIVNSL